MRRIGGSERGKNVNPPPMKKSQFTGPAPLPCQMKWSSLESLSGVTLVCVCLCFSNGWKLRVDGRVRGLGYATALASGQKQDYESCSQATVQRKREKSR